MGHQQPFAVLFLALCVVVSFTSAGEFNQVASNSLLSFIFDVVQLYIEPGIKQKFPRIPNLLTFFFQGLREANKTDPTTTSSSSSQPPALPTPFLVGLQEGAAAVAASSEIESTTLPPILPNALNSYYNIEGETLSSAITLPYSGVDGQRRVGNMQII